MLYTSIVVVAASALTGFASAQNSSLPIPCCSVPVGSVPRDTRDSWCNANENTCVELCGGQGKIANNGNSCFSDTLNNTCKCSNGTDITSSLSQYQQSVPGQMCAYWFDACINATGSDASAQYQCITTKNTTCGNKVTDSKLASSSGSSTPSSTGSSSGSSSSSSSSSAKGNGAAGNLAYFAMPVLAGGLLAVFGL